MTTPSQTVGPFFSIGLTALYNEQVAPAAVSGERVLVRGHVYDGDGLPVPDAVLELWQADAQGRYANGPEPAEFQGFGRVATDERGGFEVQTIKPGRVPGANAWQAPHISITVFMRGLLKPLHTRLYFPSDGALHAKDPVLQAVPEARRATLIARGSETELEWDIHLQGERETVIFSY